MSWLRLATSVLLMVMPVAALAADSIAGMPALTVTTNDAGNQEYSVSLQILFVMTVLSLLPAFLLLMTSFTRIIVVLAILRQAMGMPSTPTNQILVGLALFLTIFIMGPVFQTAYVEAVQPYMEEQITADEALEKAQSPFRQFMLAQTRESDLELFAGMAGGEQAYTPDTIPMMILMPAFVTSELKTAFQIGFLLFLPFIVIDLVVASVLMAMGMMMLSPLIVSLPFKVMLFVLIDGWALVLGTLAASFGV